MTKAGGAVGSRKPGVRLPSLGEGWVGILEGRQCRGVRIVVSGAYEMSLVACGRLTGFVGIKADVVSHAAATPLVRAAGGKVTRLDGRDSDDADFEKIATNGLIHDELLAALKGV